MGFGLLADGSRHSAHATLRREVPGAADTSIAKVVFDLLPDGVAIIRIDDHSARLVAANRALAELAGFSVADLLEQSPLFAGIPWLQVAAQRCLAPCLEDASQGLVEVVAGEFAGVPRVLRLQAIAIEKESLAFPGCLLLCRDISSERRQDHAVWRDERLVGIGLLATGIAHEVNNPLGSALLAAETALVIKDKPSAGDQLTACLNNIVASTDRCGQIVRTLLRYSRDEPTERQCCSMNDVAKQAIDQIRSYADSHSAIVRLERDAQMPLAPMNPLEIELVLVNLIRNAIQACERRAEIAVNTAWTDDLVLVSVSDNGRGMTSDQIAHMFEPMYTTRQKSGGFGFGLAIASGIVQRHHGTMNVTSRPDAGTTVTVSLPLAAPLSQEDDQSRADDHGADSHCRR